jgi:peptide-methionine (S)-S-oxide reductase
MTDSTQKAILAGGCFWGMQDLIRKRPGVISTRVGYTGGDVANATYRHHGSHAEAIEIIFDPAQVSYRELLELFFQIHDPTTRNRQGGDVGSSYRSAIFYLDDEQRRGHDRRCRRFGALARSRRHRGRPSRPILGG